MDLTKIKARLEALNQANQSSSEISAKFWKPDFGKTEIRIVPSVFDKDNPFTELIFHTVLSKYPILSLSNFHEQDPVEKFVQELKDKGGSENWSVAGKLSPRSRYFVPVIVRGEEDKGVRLWNIGITLYKVLLGFAADEEIGDYTDITSGFDVKVTKTKADPYPEITVSLARKASSLSDDKAQVEKWLTEQPNPLQCYKRPEYEHLRQLLADYFTGGKKPATPTVPAEAVEAAKTKSDDTLAKCNVDKLLPKTEVSSKEEVPAPKEPVVTETVKSSVKAAPKSVVSTFDELFGDVAPGKTE